MAPPRDDKVAALEQELRDALERQTATAEVLAAMSRSPFELEQILQTIVEAGIKLCRAETGRIFLLEDGVLRERVKPGGQPSTSKVVPDRGSLVGRAVLEGRTQHAGDVRLDPEIRYREGPRTRVAVPIVSTGTVVGVLNFHRPDVAPFSASEIDLLETFADQAAIAIENVRLFNETKEALGQQRAVADVLKTISRSVFDLAPVLAAVVKNAARLCDADAAWISRVEGDTVLVPSLARWGVDSDGRPLTDEFSEVVGETRRFEIRAKTIMGQPAARKATVTSADLSTDPDLAESSYALRIGAKSVLGVPLMREDVPIGVFVVARHTVRPFSDREIQLAETFADQAAIAVENVRLFNETKESLEQQTATAEVLKAISRTSFELKPILDTLTQRARELCDADTAAIRLQEGELYRSLSDSRADPAQVTFEATHPRGMDRRSVTGRVAIERAPVMIVDVRADPDYDPTNIAPGSSARTVLGVPLLKDGEAIGVMLVRRNEVRAFSNRQIQLVQTFADQAVIAIENVRLFNETKDALERQTATGEVLRAIAGSPTDEQPVLDAIARNAVRFCGAEDAAVLLARGDVYRAAAHEGPLLSDPNSDWPIDETSASGRAMTTGELIHLPDIEPVKDEFALSWDFSQRTGQRAMAAAPLVRSGKTIGAILLRRKTPGPFAERQLDLLRTFADQAVIAIENVRLFNETKEALEHQRAIAEILEVVSRSPSDVQPVFDAIARSAVRLTDADHAGLFRAAGDHFDVIAGYDPLQVQVGTTIPMDAHVPLAIAFREQRTIHVADVREDPRFPQGPPLTRLGVPITTSNGPFGSIVVGNTDVRPFTERQVALIETFARQAGIAIENVRLFNETKESLEQQTAISQVLESISGSPTDVLPVLGTISRNAARLCDAQFAGVMLLEDGRLMSHQARADGTVSRTEGVTLEGSVSGRAMAERRAIHVEDLDATDEFPATRASRDRSVGRGAPATRTVLAVPLIRQDEAIGTIFLRRKQVRPFSPREIALVETFARQAVIAIENVRLFNETKEALERQTATSDVLKAISDSAFDLQPMFDRMLAEAARLCRAEFGVLYQAGIPGLPIWVGRPVAYLNVPPRVVESNQRVIENVRAHILPGQDPGPDVPKPLGMRVYLERATVHVPDILDDPELASSATYRELGVRAVLGVPMRHKGEYAGTITLWKRAPGPFDAPAIRLVESFADQAAIAIENVRLFNETKEALEQQRAIADVLAAISTATTDPQPVFDVILKRAVELCGADQAVLRRLEGDVGRVIASFGLDPIPALGSGQNVAEITPGRRIVGGEDVVHIRDVASEPVGPSGETAARRAYPTRLGVAVRIDGRLYGWFNLVRSAIRPFSDREIQLVQTFAEQAAIAIENVRLFNETKEALEQQRAVAEVLKTISRSVFDLRPVLDTVVENAARLAQADMAWLSQMIGEDEYKVVAQFGEAFSAPEVAAEWRQIGIRRVASSPSLMGRVLRARQQLHIADISADPELLQSSPLIRATGARTVLAVPMLREGRPIGGVVAGRVAVRPFSEREIELVQTFADQAAIAIENVRLFNEIQDKSRQLEVASRHKSEFLANMSHELRTPLNAIIGFTDVMLQEMFGPLNEKQKEYLDDVRSSGTHLLTLINDILDLSKIEAGRVDLELSEFSLAGAIDNALTLVRERAARHGITVAAEVSPEVGPVVADERKVKQIVVNLLSNAVKFTHEGGSVGITARCEDDRIEVAVRDTGIGIAPEDQDRVFEEFQQVGKDPDRSREGTGLGLALAKRYVELHGGRIWVESEVGKGSTFTFSIPVRQTAAAQA